MDLIETYSLRPKNIHHVRLIVSVAYKLTDVVLLWEKNTVAWLISIPNTIKRTGWMWVSLLSQTILSLTIYIETSINIYISYKL